MTETRVASTFDISTLHSPETDERVRRLTPSIDQKLLGLFSSRSVVGSIAEERDSYRGATVFLFRGIQLRDYERGASSLLTQSELHRYAAGRRVVETRRRLTTRALLRILLGCVVRTHPTQVRLQYLRAGKPTLPASAVRFNVSHSHECCLIALSQGAAVGVDIEYHRPLPNIESISRYVMSDVERHTLQSLPDTRRCAYFYDLWTAKEASLKCIGIGLGGGMRGISIASYEQKPIRLSIHDQHHRYAHLQCHPLCGPSGYSSALVIALSATTEPLTSQTTNDPTVLAYRRAAGTYVR